MQNPPKMMKVETLLLASALLILLLLTACGAADQSCGDGICAGDENLISCPADCAVTGIGSASGLRYVSFSGRIKTLLNKEHFLSKVADGEGLVGFEYSGEYSIQLWFPMVGGPALRQENEVALTKLEDVTVGRRDCEWIPDENAFEPLAFELRASLEIGAGDASSGASDLLRYRLVDMPASTADPRLSKLVEGTVTCPYRTPPTRNFWDPAAIAQMLALFGRPLKTTIHLDVAVTNVIERRVLSPTGEDIPELTLGWVTDVPQGVLTYEIVSDPSAL